MSVLVTVKLTGDVAEFRTAVAERGDEFTKVAEQARPKGCLHHQFAVGDGYVLVVDEWESAGAFQEFFSDPELHKFISSVGSDASVPPEITIADTIASPDRF